MPESLDLLEETEIHHRIIFPNADGDFENPFVPTPSPSPAAAATAVGDSDVSMDVNVPVDGGSTSNNATTAGEDEKEKKGGMPRTLNVYLTDFEELLKPFDVIHLNTWMLSLIHI